MERDDGHLRRAADLIKVDDVTDTPVSTVENLIIEPRAATRHHGAVSAETRTSTPSTVVVVVVAASDGTCTRYL